MFQEYDFEVVVKLGRLNMGRDHLSCIEIGEEPTNLEEGLPNMQLFAMHVADGNFEDIALPNNKYSTGRILYPTK